MSDQEEPSKAHDGGYNPTDAMAEMAKQERTNLLDKLDSVQHRMNTQRHTTIKSVVQGTAKVAPAPRPKAAGMAQQSTAQQQQQHHIAPQAAGGASDAFFLGASGAGGVAGGLAPMGGGGLQLRPAAAAPQSGGLGTELPSAATVPGFGAPQPLSALGAAAHVASNIRAKDNRSGFINTWADTIKQFVENQTERKLELPAGLSPYDRRELHRLAAEFNLSHQSVGTGPQRHMVLEKDALYDQAPMEEPNADKLNALIEDEKQKRRGRDGPKPFHRPFQGRGGGAGGRGGDMGRGADGRDRDGGRGGQAGGIVSSWTSRAPTKIGDIDVLPQGASSQSGGGTKAPSGPEPQYAPLFEKDPSTRTKRFESFKQSTNPNARAVDMFDLPSAFGGAPREGPPAIDAYEDGGSRGKGSSQQQHSTSRQQHHGGDGAAGGRKSADKPHFTERCSKCRTSVPVDYDISEWTGDTKERCVTCRTETYWELLKDGIVVVPALHEGNEVGAQSQQPAEAEVAETSARGLKRTRDDTTAPNADDVAEDDEYAAGGRNDGATGGMSVEDAEMTAEVINLDAATTQWLKSFCTQLRKKRRHLDDHIVFSIDVAAEFDDLPAPAGSSLFMVTVKSCGADGVEPILTHLFGQKGEKLVVGDNVSVALESVRLALPAEPIVDNEYNVVMTLPAMHPLIRNNKGSLPCGPYGDNVVVSVR